MGRKLEIGPGDTPMEEYEYLDIRPLPHVDIVADARNIPVDDCTFEEVKVINLLEHFPHHEIDSILKEWYRVLKYDGELHILVPNIEGIFKQFYYGEISDNEFITRVYGGQDYEYNFHYTGFTTKTLSRALDEAGFSYVTTEISKDAIVAKGVKCL